MIRGLSINKNQRGGQGNGDGNSSMGSTGSPDIRIKNYRGTDFSRKNLAQSPGSKNSRRGIASKMEARNNGLDEYNPLKHREDEMPPKSPHKMNRINKLRIYEDPS